MKKVKIVLKYLGQALALALLALFPLSASAEPAKVTITAKNFQFTPGVVTLKVGQPTQLTFVSSQGVHGLTDPDIGLTQSVVISSTPSTVTITPQKVGTFVAHCYIVCGTGHFQMAITFRVVK